MVRGFAAGNMIFALVDNGGSILAVRGQPHPTLTGHDQASGDAPEKNNDRTSAEYAHGLSGLPDR